WILGFFALIVVVVIGLIGWRGDRLRSPGTIDSPVSREGAFLVNNLLFAGFAFVVLLGTVFPLVTEALKDDRITVGRPYFDRMSAPIAVSLLFLMAVAPVLPWRKAAAETLRDRMQWPFAFAVLVTVALVASGLRGWLALLAFFLGGLAGGSAIRQLLLATRRNGWRGLVGRTNGGMVVHLGVVLIAVAFAGSAAYASRAEVSLAEGESTEVGGHKVTYLGTETRRLADNNPKAAVTTARLRVDDGQVYEPAITQYRFQAQGIGTPSVRTGLFEDVYTTLVEAPSEPGGRATVGVLVHPLTIWLWTGAGLMAVGTLLAAVRAGRTGPPPLKPRSPPPPARRQPQRQRAGGAKRDLDRIPVGARDRKATS
ncbi:MAG: cytochrome c-type biogenesis CcmF C-terminal domain-containing protein, partial [Acidimicrobiales bacterium]